MNIYWALVAFAIFMMVAYCFAPQINRFIRYLEAKGHQDGQDSARH